MSAVLQTNLGSIVYTDDFISAIAGISTTECYGVVGMSSRKKLSDGIVELLKKDNLKKGVKVYSDESQALKIDYVVSPEEKHQRSQRLLALSDEKTQAFYARHIGQTMSVLMEKSKAGTPMHGFTENYIRVEVEADNSLDNQVINVRLGDFNEDKTALKGTILI